MIQSKKDLKDCLKYEKNRYCSIPKFWRLLSFLGISENAIIWRYQTRLRKWEYHKNTGHKRRASFNKILCNRLGRKYGIHISPNNFDFGLKIMHLGSILVNSNSRIGKNCSIHINTAFVATGGTSDSPVLGDNCIIGIGVTLVGGIQLGNNVAIGAGAVVTKSFTENHITLGGVPAKIISYKAFL